MPGDARLRPRPLSRTSLTPNRTQSELFSGSYPYFLTHRDREGCDVMLRADELTVVHHDDTVSRFTDVRYTLGRDGLRLITAGGGECHFPYHDVLLTHASYRAVA
jgi:hypothetical protein